MAILEYLIENDACKEAVKYFKAIRNDEDWKNHWNDPSETIRGNPHWAIWLCGKMHKNEAWPPLEKIAYIAAEYSTLVEYYPDEPTLHHYAKELMKYYHDGECEFPESSIREVSVYVASRSVWIAQRTERDDLVDIMTQITKGELSPNL